MKDSNVDLTGELLRGMRLSGVSYSRIELGSAFGVEIDFTPGKAQLLFLSKGTATLLTNSGTELHLESGDAILMPQGAAYKLFTGEITEAVSVKTLNSKPLCTLVRNVDASWALPDDERMSVVFSGCMDFELGCFQPLIKTMPEYMSARELKTVWVEIQPLLRAMEKESLSRQAGYASVLARLADIVSCLIVRGWIESGIDKTSSLLQVLRDPKISEAINYMHNEPGANWSVESLASKVGVSRSVFARRFQQATMTTPVRYLTELRMKLAVRYMSEDNMMVEPVALQLGYSSSAAFTRAYKRIIGHSPKASNQ